MLSGEISLKNNHYYYYIIMYIYCCVQIDVVFAVQPERLGMINGGSGRHTSTTTFTTDLSSPLFTASVTLVPFKRVSRVLTLQPHRVLCLLIPLHANTALSSVSCQHG